MKNPGKNFREKLKWGFVFFLARRLPDCKTITQTLSASLDRELSLREKIVTRLHLFTCAACQNYVKQINFMREAFQIREETFSSERNAFAPRLSTDAKERMKNALKQASGK
jgi:anti-sigma factor RsiW